MPHREPAQEPGHRGEHPRPGQRGREDQRWPCGGRVRRRPTRRGPRPRGGAARRRGRAVHPGQDEQGQADRVALDRAVGGPDRRVGGEDRLGQPRTDVALAARSRRVEPIQAQARARRREPCGRRLDPAPVDAGPAQPRVLDGVLGVSTGSRTPPSGVAVRDPGHVTALDHVFLPALFVGALGGAAFGQLIGPRSGLRNVRGENGGPGGRIRCIDVDWPVQDDACTSRYNEGVGPTHDDAGVSAGGSRPATAPTRSSAPASSPPA